MTRIVPNLWFDHQAEEAANYYVSIFKGSKIVRITRYGKEGFETHGMKEGTVMTVDFELDGTPFVALNGGPHFTFNEAVSFVVECNSQKEIDYYWEELGAGGDPDAQMCGWLKDRFGVSWQVVPVAQMNAMFDSPDAAKRGRAMEAMLTMRKLDMAALQKAFDGR